jgi:hypothetical protein
VTLLYFVVRRFRPNNYHFLHVFVGISVGLAQSNESGGRLEKLAEEEASTRRGEGEGAGVARPHPSRVSKLARLREGVGISLKWGAHWSSVLCLVTIVALTAKGLNPCPTTTWTTC